MPCDAGRLASPHLTGRRRADLSAPDFAGLFGGESWGAHRAQFSPRTQAAVAVREREADSARDWHWRANSFRPEPAADTATDESSQKSCGAGRLWHRDCRTGSGGIAGSEEMTGPFGPVKTIGQPCRFFSLLAFSGQECPLYTISLDP